jgi:hypothetical protein
MSPLYQHPNIATMDVETLQSIILTRQQQRLVTAIEVDTARKRKLTKLSSKNAEAYTKLGDRCSTRLAKIGEMLKLCETDVYRMGRLANENILIGQELGDEPIPPEPDTTEPEPEPEELE